MQLLPRLLILSLQLKSALALRLFQTFPFQALRLSQGLLPLTLLAGALFIELAQPFELFDFIFHAPNRKFAFERTQYDARCNFG